MSKSKIFFYACVVFIVGIFIASFLSKEIICHSLYIFAGIMVFVIFFILIRNTKMKTIALWGLFLFLAFWRYSLELPRMSVDRIWYYNGQFLTMEGHVVSEPDKREKNMKLEVEIREVEGLDFEVNGQVLITTNLYPGYKYGDLLRFQCELINPEPIDNFAYDRYLARHNIYSLCYYPYIEKIGEGEGSFIMAKIIKYKGILGEFLDRGLSADESALGRAMILGDKRALSAELRNDFARAGLSHVVAISGMHISILSVLVLNFLLYLGCKRSYAFYISVIFLATYIIMIGVPASAARAGLMGFLVLLALRSGRLSGVNTSIFSAAFVLLMFNPFLLRGDVGFQLSFLAVLGIVHIYPIINNWRGVLAKKGWKFLDNKKIKIIIDILAITVSAQIFTLPIMAYNFSQVSIISIFANLLVLWALPFLMFSLIIGLLLSFLFPKFVLILFFPSKALLRFIIITTHYLTEVPCAYIDIDYLWIGWMIVYYVVIVCVVIIFKRRACYNI